MSWIHNNDPAVKTLAAVISLDGQPSSTACPHCGQLLSLVVNLHLADVGRKAEFTTDKEVETDEGVGQQGADGGGADVR